MTQSPFSRPLSESDKIIRSSDDLPPLNGDGRHELEDNTAYLFKGFIASPNGLELGDPSPIMGQHGATDGFIHTGTGTAVTGQDVGFFARDMYLHAPGGTVFDLSATTPEEMLVESISVSDAAGLGTISDLGTISGFRVPTFKGCNLENFDSGFTLTGSPDKVFFEGCPFRTVTASNVTILHFDSGFSTDIIDMPDNYFKGVQSDTNIVDVDAAATINEVFQYRGNTHDASVAEDNILNGAANLDDAPYRVVDSFPLRNSKAFVDYTLDATTTTTISTQAVDKFDSDAYVKIGGSTTTATPAGGSRFNHSGNNESTYTGDRDRVAELDAAIGASTGTSDIIAVAWFVNGSQVDASTTRIQMNQQGGGVSKTISAIGVYREMEPNDSFEVRIANLGSTTDIDVGELNVKITT